MRVILTWPIGIRKQSLPTAIDYCCNTSRFHEVSHYLCSADSSFGSQRRESSPQAGDDSPFLGDIQSTGPDHHLEELARAVWLSYPIGDRYPGRGKWSHYILVRPNTHNTND